MADLLYGVQKISAFGFIVSSMLGMGMGLSLSAILAPLRDVRFVMRALVLNFVLAPAFAWLLTVIIPLQTDYAVGLLLIAGAAGAPFLPTLVKNARGDLVLSVAIMSLLTAGTLLFMPFALPLKIPDLQADPRSIARPLILLIVLPLIIGMLIAGLVPSRAMRAAANTHSNWERHQPATKRPIKYTTAAPLRRYLRDQAARGIADSNIRAELTRCPGTWYCRTQFRRGACSG